MKQLYRFLVILFVAALCASGHAQTTATLPLASQTDFAKLHKFVFWAAGQQYRGTSKTINTSLFAPYGEQSIYLVASGSDAGTLVYPDTIPQLFGTLSSSTVASYDFTKADHWAVHFDRKPKKIAVFRSKVGDGNSTLSWQALYFQKLFDDALPKDAYYFIDEDTFNGGKISDSTELIVFPSVKIEGQNYTFYVDQIAASMPSFAAKIKEFVKKGGNLYCEGNGALFLENAGLLADGAINYAKLFDHDAQSYYALDKVNGEYPVSLASSVAGLSLYGTAMPEVISTDVVPLYTVSGKTSPALFCVKNSDIPFSHQVVVNLGLSAVQATGTNKKQSLYTLQSILGFFSSKVDVTRSVRNVLNGKIVAGANAIAYDVVDTFTVNVLVRNLSGAVLTDVTCVEQINPYFRFGKSLSGTATVTGQKLMFSGFTLNAYEEKTLSYTLITPQPDSKLHEAVDTYLAESNFISASNNSTTYSGTTGTGRMAKSMAYADLLFSARIFADADVNWKNFLSLEYQPFKVFLNMENKARTSAEDVVYTQYVPKDVPYYQSDQSINIPILRTPGGKFVTVMRGSNDQKHPDYDFDNDGLPDAWLDTASIYPKGYTLTEDSVYWANPWAHLKTGDASKLVFEDIDGDGAVAQDANNDGVVDVEEPGDKIRVWKITWKINAMAGYEYYEPYCSYELWLDPPKQVELSAGVAQVYDSLTAPLAGMYYPFTPTLAAADKNNKAWERWMETDANGKIIWKELVLQSANNYEGYTFIDTSKTHYKMRPTDKIIGRAPQPHNEFIAVVSMGGEEIDMTHWTPSRSLYSNIDYKTIFGEQKRLPIRTTYTYYAPLPNPLQFEYLTDKCTISDSTGKVLSQLPHRGKATLQFDVDASTEYSYYWIRGMGHDVDYNDPSAKAQGAAYDKMGDGVFGYFVYEIPKGMGGYSITLPRNDDGTFKLNDIVQINGKSFEKWLDNPNTHNEVEVWENALSYQIYIPQVLIPPALDDDNKDGIDDWIDDRGDRFSSKTGYLHDDFMLDNGELYPKASTISHTDNLAGVVDSGWVAGADKTFGDDEFEALGKTHFTIKANFEGKGREGSLEISKGGTLVVEEIFGGSPWVIFSHNLSGTAEGVDLSITSSINPSVVKIGVDTVYLKHTIEDKNEPHSFDINFDPYHASLGATDANFTTLVGAKDPCNLLEPAIAMPAIVDPSRDVNTVKLIPLAASLNKPELAGYPKTETGSFIEIRVEASNCSNDDWHDVTITPTLPAGASLVMQYVAYPRPLVPNDNIGVLQAGWRFNQPEGEVLVNLGNKIPLIQPTRRAYFVYLLKIDKAAAKGIYEVSFTVDGKKIYYTGENHGSLSGYQIPNAKYCVAEKNSNGTVKDFEKMVLGQVALKQLEVTSNSSFKALNEAKWSLADVSAVDYKNLKDTLKPNGNIINLNKIGVFPSKTAAKFFILQPGIVDSYNSDEAELKLTNGQNLKFSYKLKDSLISSDPLKVTPIGPKVRITHTLFAINGAAVKPASAGVQYQSDKPVFASTLLKVKNYGADISKNTIIKIQTGNYFDVIADSLPKNATVSNKTISLPFGDMTQGEEKQLYLYFVLKTAIPQSVDIRKVINKVDIEYSGTAIAAGFRFANDSAITASLYDFEVNEITYTQIDAKSISITAKAFNKGLAADNVWFRIYPVIGQGAHEFALVEKKLTHFASKEEVLIQSDYTLPNIDKSLEMFTRIDDENAVVETNEQNNSLKTGFILTSTNDLSKDAETFKVFPSVFTTQLTFDYVLSKQYSSVQISIVDAAGMLVKAIPACPANAGSNRVLLNNLDVATGVYFYKIEAGKEILSQGKLTRAN